MILGGFFGDVRLKVNIERRALEGVHEVRLVQSGWDNLETAFHNGARDF